MAEEFGKLSVDCEGEEVRVVGNSNKAVIGFLEVYIYQARDIHNICIYHNQDVYAKIFLTDDPEQAASTQVVNGGGKNPVFNESVRVNVRTIECLLRCEIWMMSRIKNFMEDQLLGFALVSLCDVVVAGNGKASGEFALSSCDLFHSPAGFVQLTVGYTGALPPVLQSSTPSVLTLRHMEVFTPPYLADSASHELEKIEFPDPKIMNENEKMISEYLKDVDSSERDLGIQIDVSAITPFSLDTQTSATNVDQTSADNNLDDTTQARPAHSPKGRIAHFRHPHIPAQQDYRGINHGDSTDKQRLNHYPLHTRNPLTLRGCSHTATGGTRSQAQLVQTPPLSVPSTHESAPLPIPQATQETRPASETTRASKSPGKEDVPSPSRGDTAEAEVAKQSISAATPLISVSAVAEQRVVQQEIIDMYTNSMQQFTQSLAKMKLPMDIEHESNTQNGKADSKSRDTAEKDMEPKCSKSSRVFYGSRAFF